MATTNGDAAAEDEALVAKRSWADVQLAPSGRLEDARETEDDRKLVRERVKTAPTEEEEDAKGAIPETAA